jgi:methyl-accepting chemotaxis protein
MDFRDVWRTVVPAFVRQRFAAKLLVALLAVVVLTVGFGALVQAQTSAELRADATDELTTTAEVRGETLDAWLSSVQRQSRLTARHPAVQSGEPDRVRSHLRELVESGTVPESVIAVHYYDTDARRILVSSNERLEGVSPAEQGAPFARNPPTFDGPDDTYVSDPFEVAVVDHPVLTVVSPVAGAEDRAVIYMIDLRERVAGLTGVTDGQIVVVNDAGEFVAHPEASRIGERWEGSEMSPSTDGTSFTEQDDTLSAATTIQAADWTVVVSVPTATAYALGDRVSSAIVGLILLTMATLGVVGATIGSDTVSSLERISRRAGQMADGELDVELSTRRDDEFADLVATFTEMRDSIRESLTAAEQARADAETARSEAQAQADRLAETASSYEAVMRAVADGDLTRRVDTDVESEPMRAVGETFNETVAEIERTVTDVKRFSEHVAREAAAANDDVAAVTETNESVVDSVGEIADGASRQAGELTQVEAEMSQLSASAEEVAATVDDVADRSRRAAEAGAAGRDRAERALAEMEEIRTQTDETATQIETLEEQVAEIGEIAEVIAGIADQTNLLALNASIEAARAGSGAGGASSGGDGGGAGDTNAANGFAVVASEVKSLAEETKESAEEVETRIEEIQRRTAETVDVVHETGERVESGSRTVTEAIDSLEEIVAHVEGIDGDIQEIASATEQQARSSEAVVETVETVAAISEQTSAEAETVDTATERQAETLTDVSEAADGLATRADRLRELLSAFTVANSHQQSPRVDATAGAEEVTTDD